MYHFICRHRNDGLYDFVLFVRCSKQEISERAVQHRKFWCFNVPVVHFNLLFLLLFGTFWRTLGTSRTPDTKIRPSVGLWAKGIIFLPARDTIPSGWRGCIPDKLYPYFCLLSSCKRYTLMQTTV